MNMLKDIVFLIGDVKRHLVKVVLLILAIELGRVIGNEFFVRLVNEVVENQNIVLMFLVGWLLTSLVTWWFDGGADYFVVKVLVGVEYLVPMRSLTHLVNLSMKFFADEGTGKLAKRIEHGADGLARLLESFCWELISSSIQLFVTIIYLSFIQINWGFVLVIATAIFVCLTLLLDRLKKEMRKKRHDLYEICHHLLFQIMQNMAIVKAFAKEHEEINRYEKVRHDIHEISLKEFRYEVAFNIIRGSLITLTLGAIFYIGVVFILVGSLKVGALVGAMNLATAALFSLFRLTKIFIRFMDNYESISRIVTFLRKTPEIVDAEDSIEIETLNGDVVFDHVYFSYNNIGDVAKDCLVDLSFTIPAGKTVAIVGPSGSGKTTLISLLLRFIEPSSGSVQVGGYDIRSLKQTSYRKFLSVVLQDSLLFDRTLGENIAGGLDVEEYSSIEESIWNALDQAHASEFVKKFGDKALDTMIGERGIKLSGGQKQRIAIAAALIRKPVVLILDEATSSLDTKSERAIQQAMKALQQKGETTIFVIAHRLSTIREADIIMVLDEGRLVQMGSHAELLSNVSGLYAQMVGVQSV